MHIRTHCVVSSIALAHNTRDLSCCAPESHGRLRTPTSRSTIAVVCFSAAPEKNAYGRNPFTHPSTGNVKKLNELPCSTLRH
jgi:hypothetical protein